MRFSIFISLTIFVCTCAIVVSGSRPVVIAHRGASGYLPEHTLAAYELAIDMGADFVEVDLCITKDGVLVGMHSNELNETTNISKHPEFADRYTSRFVLGKNQTFHGWFIEDFTLEELRTLRVVERFPFRNHRRDGLYQIPTLEEAIQLIKAKEVEKGRSIGIYVETKLSEHFEKLGLPVEDKLLDLFSRSSLDKSLVYIESFEQRSLKKIRQMSDWKLVQLIASWETDDVHGEWSEMVTNEGLENVKKYADAIGPNKLLLSNLINNENLSTRAHNKGLLVHTYTMRSEPQFFLSQDFKTAEDEFNHVLELGVDGFFTDNPDIGVSVRNNFYDHRNRYDRDSKSIQVDAGLIIDENYF